jgi:endonuclease/exonuclease/phosphatase family metal-dependent hydrolase
LKAKPGFEDARKAQATQLITKLNSEEFKEHGLVICGDFNDTPDSPAILEMKKSF